MQKNVYFPQDMVRACQGNRCVEARGENAELLMLVICFAVVLLSLSYAAAQLA